MKPLQISHLIMPSLLSQLVSGFPIVKIGKPCYAMYSGFEMSVSKNSSLKYI